MSHTPGPWVVSDTLENCIQIKAPAIDIDPSASDAARDYFQTIATVTQRDPHPRSRGGISRETCMANAALIQAAPELLKACLWLLTFYEARMKPEDLLPDNLGNKHAAARSAVALARRQL